MSVNPYKRRAGSRSRRGVRGRRGHLQRGHRCPTAGASRIRTDGASRYSCTPAVATRVKEAGVKAGVPYSQLCREWIEQGLTAQDANVLVPLAVLNRLIAHAAQSGQAA